MGQLITLLKESEDAFDENEDGQYVDNKLSTTSPQSQIVKQGFPDLSLLPRELAFAILSNLNATDLCLAACVWRELAYDELLWRELCRNQWPYCSAYRHWFSPGYSFRCLYLRLDEARLTFKADAFQGMAYLHKYEILDDNALEVARFLHHSENLDREQLRRYLEARTDVLDQLMLFKSYRNEFLPNALRRFFKEVPAPNVRNDYLSLLVNRFSTLFVQGNPHLQLSHDQVYILCFSLIMLSVDLCSPHVKNKMSKREFIRNTRGAAQIPMSDEDLGHLYDNIYLLGHVAGGQCGLGQRRHCGNSVANMLHARRVRRRRWVF